MSGPTSPLAPLLEERKVVRNRLLKDSQMTKWLNEKAMGVKSVKAMGLNAEALEVIADWWCPHFAAATAIRIGVVRNEVQVNQKLLKVYHMCWYLG